MQFLAFFKMAVKFLSIALFFALVVIKPVHDTFEATPPGKGKGKHGNETETLDSPLDFFRTTKRSLTLESLRAMSPTIPFETDYLWMYLVFAYFFSIVLMYMIISNTRKIIEIRQEYLGSQTTITDRTIRLSGIPKELQAEDKIKEFMEGLDIGKVESVTLCRQWKELDDMMVKRNDILRRLEEAWTVYLGFRRVERNLETLPILQPSPPGPGATQEPDDADEESDHLLGGNGQSQPRPYARTRPKMKIRFGRLWLQSKEVDAIDYHEEKLRITDDKIRELRRKEFEPTPLAFVTMDSVAACQMAVQAVLDPSPLQLLANLSPAPSDVVWTNTYLPRRSRMLRAWSITVLIVIFTVFWSLLLVPLAGALNTTAIRRVSPQFADWLDEHEFAQGLVQTQLPTLITSLLNVAVPYFYSCKYLSHLLGIPRLTA